MLLSLPDQVGTSVVQGGVDAIDVVLGVAKEHRGVFVEEQRISNTCISTGHATLHHDDIPAVPDLEHRHAGYGAVRVRLGTGVDDVIGPDDKCEVCLREFAVDFIHLENDVIGDVRLGEQNIHMSWQSAGDRVDGETDLDPGVSKFLDDLGEGMLGLGNGHSIPGHDHDSLGIPHQVCSGISFYGSDIALRFITASTSTATTISPESTENDTDEGTIHTSAHDEAEDGTTAAHERPRNDQQVVAEHESGSSCGPPGIGVEHGNDDGHVGSTDCHHHVHAEEGREDRGDDQGNETDRGIMAEYEPDAKPEGDEQDQEIQQVSCRQDQWISGHRTMEFQAGDDRAGEGDGAYANPQEDLDGMHRCFSNGHFRMWIEVACEADQDSCCPNEGMQQGDQLRHLRHLDPGRQYGADDHGWNHGQYKPAVERNSVAAYSGNEGEQHARDAHRVSSSGRFLLREATEAQNEEHGGDEVGDDDQGVLHEWVTSGTWQASGGSPGTRRRC